MLNDQELRKIRETLHRDLSPTEFAMFTAMWSEHCSYKSSKHWFKLFADVSGTQVKLGIGEGTGIVDIGDGQYIGFKVESHNHPSAIDPFNGAATGVGGIIRDIISQGCQPIALLDSLRFGNLDSPHTQYLVENVVRGISSYGNCVGIPNIGGDIAFDPSYERNCLVNVMCVGLIQDHEIIHSIANHVGDLIVIFGSKTGRDGIGGVAFASETLKEKSSSTNRPAVQIGDPAAEKVLIDIIEELISKKLINGMQDLGGGGLTCATSEIVFAGKKGIQMNIDSIPLRETNMEPWEVMISESQERMLIIIDPKRQDVIQRLFKKYDMDYGVIGCVIAEDKFIVENSRGEKLVNIPVSLLVNGFIRYTHPQQLPEYYQKCRKLSRSNDNFEIFAQNIFNSPSLASKRPIYEQYDLHVQTRTLIEAGNNAGVLDVGFNKAIGFVLDSNDYQCAIDPHEGIIRAVLRCIGKLSASGLIPYALVDGLNYGNPEKPDSYWQFVESLRGLGEIVHAIQIPVIGGNVSFYNESESSSGRLRINPTPIIGMMGLSKDKTQVITSKIKAPNSKLIQIGEVCSEIDGSEAIRHTENNLIDGKLIASNFKQVNKVSEQLRELMTKKMVKSAIYISRGGLFSALCKMCFETTFGIEVKSQEIPQRDPCSLVELFFSESPGRYIIEVDSDQWHVVDEMLQTQNIPHGVVGTTTENYDLKINEKIFSLTEIEKQWQTAISKVMNW